MVPLVERRSVLPARLAVLVWALALVLAAMARGQNVATTISASPNCISPGGTTNVKVIGKATANDTNAHLFLCCPPGTVFGSQTVSSTGGAPTLGYCDTGYGNCQYTAGGPFDGVGIQCNGAGSFPQNSTVTMVVPVTAPANLAATSFNCRAIGFDSASIQPVPAFLSVPTQCTPAPSIKKTVSDEVDWAFGNFAGSTTHVSFQTSLVCYEIAWTGSGPNVTDVLPSDFAVESCTPFDRRAYYCYYDQAHGEIYVDSQSGLSIIPSSGKITVCGRFTRTHPAPGQPNVAVLTASGGTKYHSNTATVIVESFPPDLTPPQIPPASDETPASSPTTFNAQVMRASAIGATSTVSFAWLSSDIDAVPAALGPTFTKTFPKPGQYTVTELATENGFTAFRDIPVTVTASGSACVPNANTLCLGAGGRFRVQVDWQDLPNRHNGVANAHPITADTGAFWFFDSSNLELVVKVLDGSALNQHFWVFYGALSNVQYEIKVTDTHTGTVRTYTNPQGTQASAADTVAFAASAADQADAGDLLPSREPAGDLAAPTSSPSIACTTGGTNLCLDGRFLVTVAWNDVPNHHSGAGTAVSLTSASGYDWFFSDTNVELILKIVDGRGLNGHFWFFYGALSNVQYTITVTDTQTGAHKTYNNPQGTQASQADTSAF